MKISGSAVLHAPPEQVWQAINDPVVLARVIPGCDALNPLGESHFGMTVTLGVAAIKGSYTGEVRLSDLVEPSSLTMRANGSGGPGTVDTTVLVTLGSPGDGTTLLEYQADAVVGGMVGGVGQRVLTGVAKKTAGLFFSAIDDVLTGKKVLEPAAAPASSPGVAAAGTAPAAVTTGVTGAAPTAAAGTSVVPAPAGRRLDLLAAAAFGAVSMAIGVLIGARAGRARNGR